MDKSPAITEAKQKIVDEILKDLPIDSSVEVDLPSEGRVYGENAEAITLRPMTFDDEKSLVNSGSEDPTNILLNRCLSEISVYDLLPFDKLYLIMKLREISYGDDYNALLICRECGAENPSTVKLSELNVNPVPDDFTDPFELKLPKLGKTIKLRYPRVKDEKWLVDPATSFDHLWRFVVQIDEHVDKSIIAAVVKKLHLVDTKTIIKALRSDYGLDTNVKFSCKDCGGTSVVDLPIDANFFDVN